jgi:hypothetical protein
VVVVNCMCLKLFCVDSVDFYKRLERYNITEERYNTLRNAGIDDYEIENYHSVGIDLNGHTVYKVKQVVELDKQRKCRILRYCCFC